MEPSADAAQQLKPVFAVIVTTVCDDSGCPKINQCGSSQSQSGFFAVRKVLVRVELNVQGLV